MLATQGRSSQIGAMPNTIRFLAAILPVLAACSGASPAHPPAPETPVLPVVVLVSLDGFRADYLDRPAAAPLRALAARGVRARVMEPVFPTKTFPNHYSLVTGLYTEHHGIIANTMEDAAIGPFRISDRAAVQDSRWWGGEPIWVMAERQGVRTAPVFWPGSEAVIGGVRPSWWLPFDNTLPADRRIAGVLDKLRLPVDSAPRFLSVYFSDLDDAGHNHGPAAVETDSAVARVSRLVSDLADSLAAIPALGGRVHLIVVSDHGMAEVSPERVVVLDDWLEEGSYRVIDWSPVLQLVPAAGRESEVVELLSRAPHLSVYRKADLPVRWRYGSHARVPPVVAVADEGWTITSRARLPRLRERGVGGDHGYDNRAPTMAALFVATGPAFQSGQVVDRVRTVDLYQLLARVLGLRPAPNDGSLDSIRVVLR